MLILSALHPLWAALSPCQGSSFRALASEEICPESQCFLFSSVQISKEWCHLLRALCCSWGYYIFSQEKKLWIGVFDLFIPAPVCAFGAAKISPRLWHVESALLWFLGWMQTFLLWLCLMACEILVPPPADWTCAPWVGSVESYPLDLKGSPVFFLLRIPVLFRSRSG